MEQVGVDRIKSVQMPGPSMNVCKLLQHICHASLGIQTSIMNVCFSSSLFTINMEKGGLGYLVSTNLPNTNTFKFKLDDDMFNASRNRVFQFVTTSQGASARTQKFQSRTIRTKGGTGFYTDALRRDERLLKVLTSTTVPQMS
jgi:hypothetical protein